MSFDIKNNIICDSSHDIMLYLIQKLECRQRNLNNYANIFNSINSIEAFYLKRKDMINLFQNLEEELHQASLAIKALLIQNKALSEEKSQSLNIKQDYSKLLKENNYLLKENSNLTQKLKEFNPQNINKNENRKKSPSFNKEYQKNKYNNNKSLQNRNFLNNKSHVNKTNYNNKGSNKNKINNKLNNNNNKNIHVNESYDDIKQLKNVKSIMEDMKRNRLKLKEVVNEHFGKNEIQ